MIFTNTLGEVNSLFTCVILILFANSLDPDQARQNLDPNCLTSDGIPETIFSKKLILTLKAP